MSVPSHSYVLHGVVRNAATNAANAFQTGKMGLKVGLIRCALQMEKVFVACLGS